MSAPGIAGIVLAAGSSSRMGKEKALLPWPAEDSLQTFLGAAIASLRPHSQLVIVVAGGNHAALKPVAEAHGAILVENPQPQQGQFTSLKVGLREAMERGCNTTAIITLVDRPPAQRATIETLLAALRGGSQGKPAAGQRWAAVPEHGGRHGHPIVAGREMIAAFLEAPPESTARAVEHAHASRIAYVPVNDRYVVANINTLEDYRALLAAESAGSAAKASPKAKPKTKQ